MIFTSVVLTFVTLAAASQIRPPAAAPGDAVRVNGVLRQDGRLQIWEIGRDRLAALPAWPAPGSIPLTAPQAVAVAQSWLSRQIPEVQGWGTLNITLRRFGTSEGRGSTPPNGWFYAVLLEPSGRQSVLPATAFSDAGRFRVVVLLDGSVVEPKIVDGQPPATRVAGASTGDTDVYKVGPGTGVLPPRPIAQPQPRYTAEAMRARIEGTVTLRCVVNADGVCEDIQVIQSLDADHGLDQEAINAARQWRFAPATRAGQPVKVAIVIQMSFNLKDRR